MMQVPKGVPGDDLYMPACAKCGRHFLLEDEKGKHEVGCKK